MRPPRRHDAQPAPAPWKFWAGMAVCGLCGAFGSRYGAEHGQAYLGAAAGSILGGFTYYRLAFARRRKPDPAAESKPEIPERRAPRYPPPTRRTDAADAPPAPKEDA